MVKITPQIRAYRILRNLKGYCDADRSSEIFKNFSNLPIFLEGENLIGVYTNDIIGKDDLIVITDLSLYIYQGEKWQSILYSEIKSTKIADSKYEIRGVDVLSKEGGYRTLPVYRFTKEGERITFEAYEFQRYINRVIDDYQLLSMQNKIKNNV